MMIRDGFIGTIGNTPLIKLRQASEETGCAILGKAEFLNPGGSVKDRAALAIVKDAEEKGRARGYRSLIVIPETQSQEKKDMLRLCGAELKEVPAVPFKNPENYVHVSRRIAEELASSEPNGAFWANQFDNTANRKGHYETTGPEIWEQTDGKVDGFICSVGTGGTLCGTAMALKERNPAVIIGLADPDGSAIYSHFAKGELKAEGNSITEGIGQGRITANLEGLSVDRPFNIPDREAIPLVFEMAEKEGFILGGSSGINVAGAIRLAKELGPGHTIVTILCDYGTRYSSKLFNPDFLRSKDLPVPAWVEALGQ